MNIIIIMIRSKANKLEYLRGAFSISDSSKAGRGLLPIPTLLLRICATHLNDFRSI